ncbi:hypothetical protein [Citricoccus sp. CH26A]|uniref:hypothetical protein n=1 Tax=Citricoccus TaxID=169133 RepID=UPI0011453B41|nr:hypothetical protein [Citricoccus sp. CH26A]
MDAGTGILEESLSLALGYLPDIRLHASLVLCVLVAAWLIAIHRRATRQPPSRSHRRKSMSRNSQSTPGVAGRSRVTSGPGFRIRWDRTIIALVAALALVTAVVTGLAAALGAGTGAAAALSALLAVAGVASLRALALRDRKRRRDERIEQAFTEAMSPARPAAGPTGHGSATVFDAASGTPTDQPEEADVVAPPAAGPRQDADPAPAPDTTPGTRADDAPRPSVPRPTYLDAAEAHRPLPAPLARPEVPAHQPGTKLKAGVSDEYLAKVQATANRPLDLDKVLERRRAV